MFGIQTELSIHKNFQQPNAKLGLILHRDSKKHVTKAKCESLYGPEIGLRVIIVA